MNRRNAFGIGAAVLAIPDALVQSLGHGMSRAPTVPPTTPVAMGQLVSPREPIVWESVDETPQTITILARGGEYAAFLVEDIEA